MVQPQHRGPAGTSAHFARTFSVCFRFIALAFGAAMIEILSATYDGNLPAFFVRLLAGLGIVLTATFIAAFCASMYVDRFDDIRLSPRSVLIAIGIGTAVALPIVVNKLVRSA